MPRILVIDDDEDTRTMLEQIMAREGFSVVTAPDGAVGVKEFHRSSADVVIVDVLMPNMDGLETIQALRKTSSGVKIIAISGGGQTRYLHGLEIAHAFGAARVFQKPVRPAELMAAVKALLAE